MGTNWRALLGVCLGALIVVTDGSVVVVALPEIKAAFMISDASLVWVMNAYLVTYAGALLLAGRLGDLVGHRLLFLVGLTVFTVASIGCGIAYSLPHLLTLRAIQGAAGAAIATSALSLIADLFTNTAARAKALGIYGFACSFGGASGVLIGGWVTTLLGWKWIFFINIPVGVAIVSLCSNSLPAAPSQRTATSLDIKGALTLFTCLTSVMYGMISIDESGWLSPRVLLSLLVAAIALIGFLRAESEAQDPLLPFALLRGNNLTVCALAIGLSSAATSSIVLMNSLYLQRLLGFDAYETGLAFLPSGLTTAVLSIGVSARLVSRFGNKLPLVVGLLITAVGASLLTRTTATARLLDVQPCMALLGLGVGIAFNPLLLAALRSAPASQPGLASGIIGAASNLGGVFGNEIAASLSSARTHMLLTSGVAEPEALNSGYHLAFAVGALAELCAVMLIAFWLRNPLSAAGETLSSP